MGDNSLIEWTDASWNIITGCSVTSPGCANCYAMKLAGTRLKGHDAYRGLTIPTKAGPVWSGEVRFNRPWLNVPLTWKRPRKIFPCATGDLFHENVPIEWLDLVFGVMDRAFQHVFQVVTKRAHRMRAYILARYGDEGAPPHIWLGISAEDQVRLDERAPDLQATPAAVRWISFEPMLGLIDASGVLASGLIHWGVAGGESGPRPLHPTWARVLRDQHYAHHVPFLFKQWGSWRPAASSAAPGRMLMDVHGDCGASIKPPRPGDDQDTYWTAWWFEPVGKKAAGRVLDGRIHHDFPRMQELADVA